MQQRTRNVMDRLVNQVLGDGKVKSKRQIVQEMWGVDIKTHKFGKTYASRLNSLIDRARKSGHRIKFVRREGLFDTYYQGKEKYKRLH